MDPGLAGRGLGHRVDPHPVPARASGSPFVWVEGATRFPFRSWVFTPVPEPKTVENRVHWDVVLDRATVDGLVRTGATPLRPPDPHDEWWVPADPEGNEFCAFERG